MTNRIDDLFDALADSDRRFLLDELDDGPRTVEQLAGTLAANSDSHDEQSALTAIHHVHLPVLQECGLVSVNGNSVCIKEAGSPSSEEVERDLVSRHA